MNNDIYEKLADEHEPAPDTSPIAQFSGEEAASLMASLMAEDADATAVFAALAGPGRPVGGERHEKSVQERFRVPASWRSYIEHAAKRDGLPSRSKYLQSLIVKDAEAHHETHRLQPA